MGLEREKNNFSCGAKFNRLNAVLKRFDGLAVAFSGGLDSTFLLAAAQRVLGRRVVAVTARSEIHPVRQTAEAGRIAALLGVRWIGVDTHEMDLAEFRANTSQRCYVCKRHLFASIRTAAELNGVRALVHGDNADDCPTERPGHRAAAEMGVAAPLRDVGLTRSEIRRLSQALGLPTWRKPSTTCLATRVPGGTPITAGVLKMVEQAEDILLKMGCGLCRVRCHGTLARIEVGPADISAMASAGRRGAVVAALRQLGFSRVTLDLTAYGEKIA